MILDAFTKYVRKHVEDGTDVAEATGYKEDVEYSGYCETCYYEETVIHLFYKTSTGEEKTYTYSGDMGELVREITDME